MMMVGMFWLWFQNIFFGVIPNESLDFKASLISNLILSPTHSMAFGQ